MDGDWIAHAYLEGCQPNISHTKLLSEKLDKDKKYTLKISGDENFDPSGQIDLGLLQVLDTKMNIKKNNLKIKAFAPAGLKQGTIQVRVGDCFGEIKIL